VSRRPYQPTARDLLPVRVLGQYEPGYWAMRLAKGAPEVGACIRWEQTTHEPGDETNRMDRSPILTARINGEVRHLDDVWTRRGRPITEAEYRFLVEDRGWAKDHAPHLPEANPHRRAGIADLPIPF
jgi:hypothetical protein